MKTIDLAVEKLGVRAEFHGNTVKYRNKTAAVKIGSLDGRKTALKRDRSGWGRI